MNHFVELVIPVDRDWLSMLDTIALPIIQSLPVGTPTFFTNDSNTVMRLRIEEAAFEASKKVIYSLLLSQLQSDEKVKVYKQNYVLEEARFGKVAQSNFHTDMFSAASEIMISLLEEAEQVNNYEIRMPYVVLAIYHIMQSLNAKEQADLAKLYIQHWMYFNEDDSYDELIKSLEETYSEEVSSLNLLLSNLDQQKDIQILFSSWENACNEFMSSFQSLERIAEASRRYKTYHYKNNELEHPRKWEIIADHIHLLMNRFGIENEDETLLMYLAYNAMKVN